MKASLRFAVVALIFGAALVMAGCGSPSSSNKPIGVSAQGNSAGAPPLPSNAGSALNPVNGIPQQALSALLGNYGGSLVDDRDYQNASQAYGFSLAVNQAQGQSYVYMNFSSGGMAFNTYLSMMPSQGQVSDGPYGASGFEMIYDFISPIINVPSISAGPIAVYVQIALLNGSQVDPAQSMIRFLDCGLSQGVSCTDFYGITFNNDLGKR